MRTVIAAAAVVAVLSSACGSSADLVTTASAATPTELTWAEEQVTFPFGSDEMFGVLTWPTGAGPHPAVVLLSGSGGADGVRANSATRTFVDHSRMMAAEGFAVLRYDPPGVGRSTGGGAIPSLGERTEETHAAVQYLQSLPNIATDRVGLQGWSQGPWVMAMTAVRYPQDVAFLISVVGSGQSVANQQVYGIRAQSQAAGLPDDDVTKAVLFGRLLIDWQLPAPIFEAANGADAQALGNGPWNTFAELAYEPGDIGPVEGLATGVEILRSIRDEPWAEALYLNLYLARLESIPADIAPEEIAALQAVMAENLMTDPKDFLTEVRLPLIAFFGEDDLNVDSQTSPGLFDQYLTQAGNEDYTIVVLPDVGHGIGLPTPGYWDTLSDWLNRRFAD
jgi:pimeloyl-ACP methyl ester carboxylesterase